jgi:NADPH-dependent 2,4-dienoyl-CoA reductase/sulfur reductase-like enzyme
MISEDFDVAVIGAGPAGLAAAAASVRRGARTVLIEREARLGGVLKQCIHDGFGLERYGEKLSGPEYAYRHIAELRAALKDAAQDAENAIRTECFVTRIEKKENGFTLVLSSARGLEQLSCRALALATGCRERTARMLGIHGTRPAGVLTAGTAQYYVNIMGCLPGRKIVILGSGDVGLIMARRLTLEGAQVLAVYEALPEPSGLKRNIAQCLNDFDIPLYTSRTVTRCFGDKRLEAVEIAESRNFAPVPGTEELVECDTLLLAAGLIPENELAESIGVQIDNTTHGPACDEKGMCSINGVFSCGNSYRVFDLVDTVSKTSEEVGANAAEWALR